MEKESRSSEESHHPIPSNIVSDGDTAVEGRVPEKIKTSDSAEENNQYVTGFKLATVIGCVTLVAFLILLDQSIISTAIPVITSQFHSLPDVGWYGSAYLLTSASFQPLTGKIYTYFKSKYTFLSFLALFEFGSLLCGVAQSSKMLIIGRAVAGLGSSGLINGALTIISVCVPLAKRPIYMGIMMSVGQLGIVLGPLIGGVLTEYTTWRWCFYINLPIGGVTAALLLFVAIPDRTAETRDVSLSTIFREKLDLLGFAIFAPAAIQFLLALEWGGNRYRWGSATVIGLLCGSAGTLCVFLVWEWHKGDAAMIPFSMVRNMVVWSSCLVQFFFMGGMLSMSYYLPIYFQAVKGVSPTLSGVFLLPSIISQIVLSITCGWLVTRLGYYTPWAITGAVLSSVGYGLLSILGPGSSPGKWIGFQIIVGIGRGCGLQIPIIAVQNNVPPASISVAMAILVFSQTFGGSLFLALSQTAFTNGLSSALHDFAPDVDVQTLLEAGAAKIRDVVQDGSLHGVLLAYSKAISYVFYLCTGVAVGTFIFVWGMGWKNVKKVKKVKTDEEG
ncbi:MAG: hypothetical protein Q9170_005052 [Blastenia crenularia]